MSHRRQGVGVKRNLAISCTQKSREVKPEGRMAHQESLLGREKREPGDPRHSLEFHQTGENREKGGKTDTEETGGFPEIQMGFHV